MHTYTARLKSTDYSHILLKAFERLRYGSLTCIFPDGTQRTFEGIEPGVDAELHFREWRILDRIVIHGDVGFGEDYVAGLWDTDQLPQLLYLLLQNNQAFANFMYQQNLLRRSAYYLKAKLRANTLTGSKRNIHHHYDLGNDFYALWLDKSMTYSCALFHGDNSIGLEAAQNAKYQRILDKLEVQPGASILEIGCGWGGFAEQAAKAGAEVTGLTISDAQCKYATARLQPYRTQIKLQDYRLEEAQYDHVVSIGMFEHVGKDFWPVYMGKVRDCLKESGTAMIQTITIREDLFEPYRRSNDFIREYIFPGGMLPTEARFRATAEASGLKVKEVFSFGRDYALTLQNWRQRFERALGEIRGLGYDEAFIRKWRFYLASCEASFRVGRIGVMQVLLSKA